MTRGLVSVLRILPVALALVAAGACEQLLTDPAPAPGRLVLALAPRGPELAVAPASSNRVRVQVRDAEAILLDTILPFDPEQEEVLVPVSFAGAEASATILVEIGSDGLPQLRGSAEILLRQGRVVEAEVQLDGAELRPLAPVSDLAAGIYHSCAAAGESGISCWGVNDVGQLGTGEVPLATLPIPLEEEGGLYAIDAGLVSTCGLSFSGEAFCWGSNEFGSLGSGGSPERSEEPVRVDADVNFAAISVGGLHACGLSRAGVAFCWGFNGFGQLGDGTTTDRTEPVPVATGLTFESLSAGYLHTCGVTTGGQALCWGLNEFGQLGDGGAEDRQAPWPVAGRLRFSRVSAGGLHTCAISEFGEAFCWGFNDFGQLGNGSLQGTASPVSLGELRFDNLSAGGLHTCGVSFSGTGYCWGYNRSGALGDGTGDDSAVPVEVEAADNFGALSAGLHHTCGTVAEGRVLCWGYNRFGQLGDGSRENRFLPAEVLEGDPFFRERPIDGEEVRDAVAALRAGTIVVQ